MIKTNILDIKEKFNTKVDAARYLKNSITNLIENEDYEKASLKIEEYKSSYFSNDIEIISMEVIIQLAKGNIVEAEKLLLKGISHIPFNLDLNFNLGYIYSLQDKYQDAIDAYIKGLSVVTNEDDREILEAKINEILQINNNLDISKIKETNNKMFPLKTEEETWVGKSLFEDKNNEGYIPLYYESPLLSYPIELCYFFKTELLKGKVLEAGKYNYENLSNTLLPLAVINEGTIKVIINEKEYKFNNFTPNRYYYIPIRNDGKVKIESNEKFIIGKPIELEQNKKHDIKLVLNLFVDGLSQKIIDEYSLEKLMPNTHKFFKKGAIFTNCHSNGEWTLASVPTIFTGKYQGEHKLFHPELLHTLRNDHKTIGEYFTNDDYMTFQVCGNWRKTPSYGYAKNFDRMIYQSGMMGSSVEEIISSFLEQIKSFGERDQFMWLSFFELHNVDENLTPKISSQIANSIEARIIEKDGNKSVSKDYDEKKIERYITEIKRLDYYLDIIYKFIEDNYSNDEILISLFSDHGQSYIDESDNILGDARTKVPYMIRGRDIPLLVSNELIENVDILPTILDKASIDFNQADLPGKVPKVLGGKEEKEYVYSQSQFPGKTIKAAVRDKIHSLWFETEFNVEHDGRFEIGDFKIILENNDTKEDETKLYIDKVERYFNVIISHIEPFIKI